MHPFFAILYVLLAAIYTAAAAFSLKQDHARLAHCYLASAFLYAVFGAYVLFGA
jgi:hypothetical protein